MMTIASSAKSGDETGTAVGNTGRGGSGHRTRDCVGGRDSVGADEDEPGRHGRQGGQSSDGGVYAGSSIGLARPSGLGDRLRLGGSGGLSIRGREAHLEVEKPITYTKGQSWYEPPKKPHVVSKNASSTESAKLLVFLLSNEGEAAKMPIK